MIYTLQNSLCPSRTNSFMHGLQEFLHIVPTSQGSRASKIMSELHSRYDQDAFKFIQIGYSINALIFFDLQRLLPVELPQQLKMSDNWSNQKHELCRRPATAYSHSKVYNYSVCKVLQHALETLEVATPVPLYLEHKSPTTPRQQMFENLLNVYQTLYCVHSKCKQG